MTGWLLLALLVGFVLPVQTGINAQLRTHLGNPLIAALVSFGVGTLALAAAALAARTPMPAAVDAARANWWQWTGGVFGAFYIAATVVLAPRLGAALLVVAIVAGQLAASLAVDHFGWIGYPTHPLNFWRIVGAACVAVGVILIQRF